MPARFFNVTISGLQLWPEIVVIGMLQQLHQLLNLGEQAKLLLSASYGQLWRLGYRADQPVMQGLCRPVQFKSSLQLAGKGLKDAFSCLCMASTCSSDAGKNATTVGLLLQGSNPCQPAIF